MILQLWNKIKNYRKTLYVSAGVSTILIGFGTIGYFVRKKLFNYQNINHIIKLKVLSKKK